MFKVIDALDMVHDAYGTFIDEYGDIQFILCDCNGEFYKTNSTAGLIRLYTEED